MTFSSVTASRSNRLKIGIAAVAAVALAVTPMLLAASPTHAANHQLGPEDVAGYNNDGAFAVPGHDGSTIPFTISNGDNYEQWHVASTSNPELDSSASLTFGECSVTIRAVPENAVLEPADPADSVKEATQTVVLKGFADGTAPVGAEAILAALTNTMIDVEQGDVQIMARWAVMASITGPDETRNAVINVDSDFFHNTTAFGPGQHQLLEDTLMSSMSTTFSPRFEDPAVLRGSLEDFDAFLPTLQDQLQLNVEEEYADATVSVWLTVDLIGFSGTEGSIVNSITLGGDTYQFGTGDCLDADPVVTPPTAPTPPAAVETAAR